MSTTAQGWHNNVWGDVGTALYDMPGTELAAVAGQLRELARISPGRAGDLFTAFASMVDTELSWRNKAGGG